MSQKSRSLRVGRKSGGSLRSLTPMAWRRVRAAYVLNANRIGAGREPETMRDRPRSSPRSSVSLGLSKYMLSGWNLLLAVGLVLGAAGCSANGGCLHPEPPVVIRQDGPVVPSGFWDTHGDGMVRLMVRVGRDGSVVDGHVESSPGHDYSLIAVETVKKWRYRPARCDGYAIGFDLSVTIRSAHDSPKPAA